MAANPLFASMAVLSLALGIGANTAIYSFMEAILMRSLPVSNPESLVVFKWHSKDFPGGEPGFSSDPKRVACRCSRPGWAIGALGGDDGLSQPRRAGKPARRHDSRSDKADNMPHITPQTHGAFGSSASVSTS
jgi:hypothetical protein